MSKAKRARQPQEEEEETEEHEEDDATEGSKKQRSSVWLLFAKADDGKHADCRVCGQSVQYFASVTSNLRRHLTVTNSSGNHVHHACAALWKRLELQVQHNKTSKEADAVDLAVWVEDQLADIKKEKKQSAKKVGCVVCVCLQLPRLPSELTLGQQQNLLRWTAKEESARAFQVLMELWMLRRGISENAMDDFVLHMALDSLAELKTPYSQHLQSRKTRTDVILNAMHHSVDASLFSTLDSLKPIIFAATSDAWTSRASLHKYISITLHWLDDRFDLHSELLSITQTDFSHTAVNIRDVWEKELSQDVLAEGTLVSMNTDNGANFRKAAAGIVAEDNALCAAHTLQVGLTVLGVLLLCVCMCCSDVGLACCE